MDNRLNNGTNDRTDSGTNNGMDSGTNNGMDSGTNNGMDSGTNNGMDSGRRQAVHASAVVKVAAALFLVLAGVMGLLLLHYAGYPAAVYVSVLFCCVSAAVYLLSSVFLVWLIRRRNFDSHVETSCLRWSHLVSGGIASIILSTLSLVVLSAYGASPFAFVTCYVMLTAVSLALISVGAYKLINRARRQV